MNGRVLARYVAPAAFLLAVTGVVLLVRSSLGSDASTTTRTTTTVARAKKPKSPAQPRVRTPAQYYVIRSGDTLESIAQRYGTDVDTLLRLNPGVEPTTLRPGERIRIK